MQTFSAISLIVIRRLYNTIFVTASTFSLVICRDVQGENRQLTSSRSSKDLYQLPTLCFLQMPLSTFQSPNFKLNKLFNTDSVIHFARHTIRLNFYFFKNKLMMQDGQHWSTYVGDIFFNSFNSYPYRPLQTIAIQSLFIRRKKDLLMFLKNHKFH